MDADHRLICDHKKKTRPRNRTLFFFVYVKAMFMQLVYFVISCVAMYLSFRRNNGINIGSLIVAFLFSPIYVAYAIAVPVKGQFEITK